MSDRVKYPSESAERFQIRLPSGLRDRIRLSAEANGRSMNTEILDVLEKAFPDQDAALSRAIDAVIARIDALGESGSKQDPRLRELRERLLAHRWFEPSEDEK